MSNRRSHLTEFQNLQSNLQNYSFGDRNNLIVNDNKWDGDVFLVQFLFD